VIRAIIAPIATLWLGGCYLEEGRDLTFAETQAYFAEHEPQLWQIIAQVEACRPKYARTGVYNAIRLSDPDGDPVCENERVEPVTDIKKAMRTIGVHIVDITLSPEGKAIHAEFTVYNAGLSVSGVSVSIVYQAEDKARADTPLSNGFEQRTLDESPHHWFWQRWAT
jgi:hypothetical protein